jgi:hypothetical protein
MVFLIQNSDSVDDILLENILGQLHLINENLRALTTVIESQSFWNSQLFAAIIGASSAILVLVIQQIWNWQHKRWERLEKVYAWITEQYHFWGPRALFDEAASTAYGATVTDNVTGKTEQTPDKALGEKMVIGLRSHVKYWRYPSFRLRRLFKKYEEAIRKFNNCDHRNRNELNEYLSTAERIFQKLTTLAFKKTGENKWTI